MISAAAIARRIGVAAAVAVGEAGRAASAAAPVAGLIRVRPAVIVGDAAAMAAATVTGTVGIRPAVAIGHAGIAAARRIGIGPGIVVTYLEGFGAPANKEQMRAQRLELYQLPDYRPKVGKFNNYGFDVAQQRSQTYTGMGFDINVHEQWAVESQGPIQDRTREHLAY